MSDHVIDIPTDRLHARALMALGVFAVLALGWFGIRWQLGNMLGEVTPPGSPDAEAVSVTARNLSPFDPSVHRLYAAARYNPADTESLKVYAESLETVVRLSPRDYRWWVELGRAYEQADRPVEAREALMKAVALNPNYAYPAWQYGNLELRLGNPDAAVEALTRSARLSSVYRERFFPLMSDYLEGDAAGLDSLAGTDPDMLAGLTKFYASRRRAEDASRVWGRLSDGERERHRAIGLVVAQAFFENHYYRVSSDLLKTLGREMESGVGKVVDGGFEGSLGEADETGFFSWRQRRVDNLDTRLDQFVRRSGRSSLRIAFKAFKGAEVVNLWQVFPVESGRSYRLRFWFKAEDLKSAGAPSVDVAGPSGFKLADGSAIGLVARAEMPVGTTDWREVSLEFVAPQGVDGMEVRINRTYCGESCPITGTLWLDDLVLEAIG